MSSTNSNLRSVPRRCATWLGAATAAALVAGSATMTMAATRGVSTASFQWQSFTPGHITHIETPRGGQGNIGGAHTDALQTSTMGFSWQAFSPGHVVHNDLPGGSTGMSGSETDALRLPLSASFHWQSFTPGRVVSGEPANGADATSGGVRTDAMSAHALRPTLVYGVDHDDAGGFRTSLGLSFRIP